MEEHEIVEKATKGDEEAFIELMHLHKEALLRTAIAFLKNDQDAIEALQEVTYRAYKKIHTVKEPTYIKTWLTRIMMNYCHDQLKNRKRIVMNEQLTDSAINEHYHRIELTEALSSLSKDEQQLVYLKYIQELKIKEIAVVENIPEGTVKSRLHKTLKTLRNYFNDKGEINNV